MGLCSVLVRSRLLGTIIEEFFKTTKGERNKDIFGIYYTEEQEVSCVQTRQTA